MARIPIEIANRELGTGPLIQYPAGSGPVGPAVEELGAAITRLAGHVQDTRERHESFDAALREHEFLEELASIESEAVAKAQPDAEGLHDSIYGGLNPSGGSAKRSRFDELFEQHATRIPESRRPAFLATREHYREAGSRRLASVQFARRREFEEEALTRVQERLIASIHASDSRDGTAITAAWQRGLDMIASMSVDERARAALAEAWDKETTLARFESRLRQEPGFAAQARALLFNSQTGR